MKIANKINMSIILTCIVTAILIGGFSLYKSRSIIDEDAQEILMGNVVTNSIPIENTIVKSNELIDNMTNIIEQTINLNEVRNNQDKINEYENKTASFIENAIKKSGLKNGWFQANTTELGGVGLISFKDNGGSLVKDEKWNIIGSESEKDEWWKGPKEKGENWSSPYYFDSWKASLVSHGKRLDYNGKFLGIVGVEINIDDIKNMLSSVKIAKTGYMILMTNDLSFIYHPNKDAKKLSDLDSKVAEDFEKVVQSNKNRTGVFFYKLDGEKKAIAYRVLSNGWILASSVKMSEFMEKTTAIEIFIFICTIVVLILGTIYSIVFSKTFTNPIKELKNNLEIISNGDLNVSLNIKSKDEIGDLANSFNIFSEKIHKTLSDIQLLSKKVSSSNETLKKSMDILVNGENSLFFLEINSKIDKGIIQLNSYVERILDNVRNQTASTEESLAALEEISATSTVINNNIKTTNESFNDTLAISNQSMNNINHMTLSMDEINNSVTQTSIEI